MIYHFLPTNRQLMLISRVNTKVSMNDAFDAFAHFVVSQKKTSVVRHYSEDRSR
jgi:hypothetical protein